MRLDWKSQHYYDIPLRRPFGNCDETAEGPLGKVPIKPFRKNVCGLFCQVYGVILQLRIRGEVVVYHTGAWRFVSPRRYAVPTTLTGLTFLVSSAAAPVSG